MDYLLPKARTANPVEIGRTLNAVVDYLNMPQQSGSQVYATGTSKLDATPVWTFWWKTSTTLLVKGLLRVNGEYVKVNKEVTITPFTTGKVNYLYYDLFLDEILQQEDNRFEMDIPILEVDCTGDFITTTQLVTDIVTIDADYSTFKMKDCATVSYDVWFDIQSQGVHELCNRVGNIAVAEDEELYAVMDVDPEVGLMRLNITTSLPSCSNMYYAQIGEACYAYSILNISQGFSATGSFLSHKHKIYGYLCSCSSGCHTHSLVGMETCYAGSHAHCAWLCANALQLYHYHTLSACGQAGLPGCNHTHPLAGRTDYAYATNDSRLDISVSTSGEHKHNIVGTVNYASAHKHRSCFGLCGIDTSCTGGGCLCVTGTLNLMETLYPCDLPGELKKKRGVGVWGAVNQSKLVRLLGTVRSIACVKYFVPAYRGVVPVVSVRGVVGVGCIDMDTIGKYTPPPT